jgi:hypothetical protein
VTILDGLFLAKQSIVCEFRKRVRDVVEIFQVVILFLLILVLFVLL